MERGWFASSAEFADGGREYLRPLFCHLLLKATRSDSPPWANCSAKEQIIHHRKTHDLTQKVFATRLGISRKTLQNWESGRSCPTKRAWKTLRLVLIPVG